MKAGPSHAPPGYACPFCALVRGEDLPAPYTTQAELVWRQPETIGFVASRQWPRNRGHVVVVPTAHHENLYELPESVGPALIAATRAVALALKAVYDCPGTSTRQHNEPAGNQEVWHYHVHVFPRFHGDGLYGAERESVPREERIRQAQRLRAQLPPLPGRS